MNNRKPNPTDLLLQQLLEAQKINANIQPQGAITLGGINKYWPQLVGIVALGYFLMGQAKESEKLVGRVAVLEASMTTINQVKADQIKSSSDMQALQIDMASVKQAQKEQATKIDNVLSAISTIGQQVQSLSQAMRGGR